MTFGERLRELRKAQGISQRALAEMIERDYTYISKIETGDTPPPSLETIHRISLALTADENELVDLANKVSIAAYRTRIAELEAEHTRMVQAFAQQLLALIVQAEENGRKAPSETFETDFLLGALDEIKELCRLKLSAS